MKITSFLSKFAVIYTSYTYDKRKSQFNPDL